MTEILVLINHFWFCTAVVSHSQPQSKWLRHNAIKCKIGLKNYMFFGNLGKFHKVKAFIQYLKFISRHNFIQILTKIVLKILIFHDFFVYPKIFLQKYGRGKFGGDHISL